MQSVVVSRLSACWRKPVQTWSNSASVSSRQGSAVSNRMLHSNVKSCKSPAAPFCQPSSTRHATLPSQQLRPSGVLCRWSDGLELTAWSPPGPNARLWLFQVTSEVTLVFAVLMYPLHLNYTSTLPCKTITINITIFTRDFFCNTKIIFLVILE